MSASLLPWDALEPERLFLAVLRGDRGARDLLGGRGWDDAAAATAAEERRRTPLPHRADLARAVGSYLAGLDAPAEARRAAERLADGRTVVVVGGQQPAVAGGPLLVFAKAVGVVSFAERIERAGAGPVVPVWWVASEDHDLDEAGSVRLGRGRDARALLGAPAPGRRMLSRVPAPHPGQILGRLGEGERAAEAARVLPDGGDLGRHAAGILSRLLGARGLVVVEPQVVRPFARSVFERDVREPGSLAARVREGNGRVRRAGFEPVLEDPEGALHFRVDGEGCRNRGGGSPADLDTLETSLSADAALRVLAQDAALPVAVQVCGPTEMEYLAAIHPARAAAGVFSPCAAPRPGVTILERRTEEALAGLGADLATLYRAGPAALRGPPAPDAPLAAEARRLRAALEGAAGDPAALPPAVRSRLGRASDGLEELAAAAERAGAERLGVGEGRRLRVLDALLPGGVPQERRWSLLPFLVRHGTGLWDRMVEELSGPEAGHRVIRV